jgi:hypothetical protein
MTNGIQDKSLLSILLAEPVSTPNTQVLVFHVPEYYSYSDYGLSPGKQWTRHRPGIDAGADGMVGHTEAPVHPAVSPCPLVIPQPTKP